jgi:hypothetical protein
MDLSVLVLPLLQAVHRYALVQLSEVRISLANQQHEEQIAEKARLRQEIHTLAQQLRGA